MEFSADIAILQSAVQLADQEIKLATYSKHSQMSSVCVVSAAISEVCHGNVYKQSADELKLEKLKLMVVLILKVQLADCMPPASGLSDGEEGMLLQTWDTLLFGLPALSWDFVFDVIQTSGLQQEVFKLLPHLSVTTAVQLLRKYLNYLFTASDRADVRTVSMLISYLGLHWKSPIFIQNDVPESVNKNKQGSQGLPAKHFGKIAKTRLTEEAIWASLPSAGNVKNEELEALVSDLLSGLESIQFNEVEETLRGLAEFSFMSLVISLYCGQGWALAPINDDQESIQKNDVMTCGHSSFAVLRKVLNSCDGCEENMVKVLISEIKDHELPVTLMKTNVSIKDLPQNCFNVLQSTIQECLRTFIDEPTFLEPLLQDKHMNVYKHLWPKLCRHLILNQYDVLKSYTQTSSPTPDILSWLDILNMLSLQVQEIQKDEDMFWQKSENRLSKALVVLEHQITGAEDYLTWLLQQRNVSLVTQPSWSRCIELGRPFICHPVIIPEAFEQLSWLKQSSLQANKSKLQRVIVGGFAEWSGQTQNKSLEQISGVYSSAELEEMFDAGDLVTSEMRVILNRLTVESLIYSVSQVSSQWVQSPLKVMQAMVQCAVNNRGQIDVLVQLFQCLPAILKFKGINQNVFITSLHDLVSKEECLLEEAVMNVTLLCRQLSLPYCSNDNLVPQAPVLTPSCILHDFALPGLVPPESSVNIRNMTSLCSQLLHTSLDVMPQLLPQWHDLVSEVNLVIVLNIVLNKIDGFLCTEFEGGDDAVNSCSSESDSLSRSEWLDCLVNLIEMLEKHRNLISDPGLVWLSIQLDRCHWTTKCYCYTLYSDFDGQVQLNIGIPHKVFELCALPFKSSSSAEDGHLSLLQFVRISDVTLTLGQSCLRNDVRMPVESSLPKMLLATAVMLPQCTGAELCRLVTFLQHWIKHNDGIKELFTGSTEISNGICCCEFIRLALQLVHCKENICYSLANLAVAVTSVIKTTILNTVAQSGALTSLCHCLIIVCKMICDWPDPDSAQHLLTLGLDVIGQIDSCLCDVKTFLKMEDDQYEVACELLSMLREECSKVHTTDLQQAIDKVLQSIESK